MDFANAATVNLASTIAEYHRHLQPAGAKPVLGRPPLLRARKKRRFCPWNAYVSHNKPSEAGQAEIFSGRHMTELGRKWKSLSAEEKAPYVRISNAETAKLPDKDDDDGGDARCSVVLKLVSFSRSSRFITWVCFCAYDM